MTSTELDAGILYDAPRRFPDHSPAHRFRVLTWDQWSAWRAQGHLVVPGVVPTTLCDDVVETLWRYLDAEPDDPATWYRIPAHTGERPTRKSSAGMVELYHHPALWAVRQTRRLYDVFVDLWGTEALWVTIDRANVNMPVTDDWRFDGFLHWDIDPRVTPAACNIQGTVTLTDTPVGGGGLQIVPELFHRFDDMADTQARADDPYQPDVAGLDVVEVPSRKGDLVIWDSRMVHGTAPNTSDRPRFAQYVAMVPADSDRGDVVARRIQSFVDRTAPTSRSMRGDEAEPAFGPPARLDELGERLLGRMPWPSPRDRGAQLETGRQP